MTLFPITRPKTSLYITADKLCVSHVHQHVGHPRLGGYREHPLPQGSIRLSPVEPNVRDPGPLVPLVQSAVAQQKQPQSVALCLPDLCARTAVMEFSSLPKSKNEQTELIAWRLKQDLNLSTEKVRISYQAFHPSGKSSSTDPPIRVLATAIRQDIVEAYEMLCIQAGLIPVSLGLASPAVFDLCRSLMESTLKFSSKKLLFFPDTLFFLYLADWGFSVLVFQEYGPTFIRIKPLRQMSTLSIQNTEFPPSSMTAPSMEDESPSSHILNLTEDLHSNQKTASLIANELLGTLQYYFDTMPPSSRATPRFPLFLAGSPEPENILPLIATAIEEEFPPSSEDGKPGIKAFPLFPTNSNLSQKTLSGLTNWTSTSLPSFAAACVAS